jgi:FecR protein
MGYSNSATGSSGSAHVVTKTTRTPSARTTRYRVGASVLGFTLLVIGVVSFRVAGSPAPAQSPIARAAASTPALATLDVRAAHVTIRKSGTQQYRAAKNGLSLRQGDTLRTDSTGSAEIDYTDGSLTRLGAATEFTLTRLTDERGGRQTLGTLTAGETWNRAAKVSETGSFEVTAGRTTAAVEGTAFAFSCSGPESARVCTVIDVVDNVKVMTTDGALVELTPGTSVTAVNDVLGPPTHLSYADLAGNPFIAANLQLDHQLGKGNGLGDIPGTPEPSGTTGGSSDSTAPTTTLLPATSFPNANSSSRTLPSTTTLPPGTSTTTPTTTGTTTTTTTTTTAPLAAPACRNGGYVSRVGAQGQTFRTEQDCVTFVVGGGTFATGIIVPAGRTATFTGARFDACDVLSYGYELDLDPVTSVTLGSKAQGCANVAVPNQTIGPFDHAVLIRVFLLDTGWPSLSAVCGDTFFSDGNHALVTGSGPWRVDLMDSGVCTSATNDPRPVPSPGQADLDLSIVLSP